MDSTANLSYKGYLEFLNWFLSTKSKYVFDKEPWQINSFAKLISEFSLIHNKVIKEENYSHENLRILSFSVEEYQKSGEYLRPILKIHDYANKFMKDYLVDFLIHGSMSTLDYSKGWSDLDTLLIIKEEVVQSPYHISNLRKHVINLIPELYLIDPLQHHQFIITTENFMLNSNYINLPVKTLELSKSLFNNSFLKITKNRICQNGIAKVNSICNLFKESADKGYMNHHKLNNIPLENNFANLNCMYQLKYFIGCIIILPSYYFDAIGEPCYKRDSFKRFVSEVKINTDILEKCSLIRSNWEKIESFPYEGNLIPSWICEILGNNYFEEAYKFAYEIYQKII